MATQNCYQILGINQNASEKTIKAAYRKLAKQYHPDRNQGDTTAEAMFIRITKAYEQALSGKYKTPPPNRPQSATAGQNTTAWRRAGSRRYTEEARQNTHTYRKQTRQNQNTYKKYQTESNINKQHGSRENKILFWWIVFAIIFNVFIIIPINIFS